MPYRESTFTATKKVREPTWFVACTIHGDFENNEGRCLLCDEDSANYEYPEDGKQWGQ